MLILSTMNLITSLILVASASCLFDSSAALQGGKLVNDNTPQPLITTLLAKDKTGVIIKTCEATIIKRTNGKAHFLTAAECVVEEDATSYHMVFYHGNAVGSPVEVPVDRTFHIHEKYVKGKQTDNLAVFSTKDEFKDIPSYNIPDDTSDHIDDNVEYFQWMRDGQHGEMNNLRLFSVQTKVISSDTCRFFYVLSPIVGHTACVSRPHYGQGLSTGQEGTPLLRRDQKDPKQFTLLGAATVVRARAATSFSTCTEFLDLKPYRSWIESLDL